MKHIPVDARQSEPLGSFRGELQDFDFKRLLHVFDGEHYRTFKIICPKCRRSYKPTRFVALRF